MLRRETTHSLLGRVVAGASHRLAARVTELQRVALGPDPEASKAFDLALRLLPLDDAIAWLRRLTVRERARRW